MNQTKKDAAILLASVVSLVPTTTRMSGLTRTGHRNRLLSRQRAKSNNGAYVAPLVRPNSDDTCRSILRRVDSFHHTERPRKRWCVVNYDDYHRSQFDGNGRRCPLRTRL